MIPEGDYIMKFRNILLIAVLTAFTSGLYAAAALEATAETDKTTGNLGDVIRYTLTVRRAGDMSQPPSIVLPSFEGFRVGGSYTNSMMNFINGAASAQNQQIVDLIAVKSGEVVIEPAKIRFMNPATKKYENMQTKAITITIGQGRRKSAAAAPVETQTPTVAPPQADIRSIKYSYHLDLAGLMPYILLGLALFAAIYFAWKKIFGIKEIMPAVLEEDLRKAALRRIKKAKELLSTNDVKGYYSELYEIIREFLNKHYNNTFSELTTQEIIRKLEDLKARPEDINYALDFMKESDLVKFADYKPSEKEIGEVGLKAEDIVNKIV